MVLQLWNYTVCLLISYLQLELLANI
jgi:hypothetical protein